MDFESAQKWLDDLVSNEEVLKMDYGNFDLQRMKALVSAYVGPIRAKIVHVAGSKGKGSVCSLLASYLARAGYNVGRYTSPHILSVCERFWLNGSDISEDEFARMVEELRDFGVAPGLTYFEALTVMALKKFKDCDYLVLEVGLGGRLDATNVVNPAVTVLTRVEMEHVGILGDTLEQILSEKLGICKEGVPLVLGEQSKEVLAMIDREYVYGGGNLGVAAAVVELLLGSVDEKLFAPVELIGRFDVRENVVYDMAHTVESMRLLLSNLSERFPDRRFVFLLSFMQGKDVSGMLSLIGPVAERVYFADSHPVRGIPAEELGEIGDFEELKAGLKKEEILVVTGSHFLVAKVLKN